MNNNTNEGNTKCIKTEEEELHEKNSRKEHAIIFICEDNKSYFLCRGGITENNTTKTNDITIYTCKENNNRLEKSMESKKTYITKKRTTKVIANATNKKNIQKFEVRTLLLLSIHLVLIITFDVFFEIA